ncbi:Bax inhibitor-1/YccA family protein [Pengzhenrongella sicca]|uniref:Bax inhibitor-1/YccA family protein n=1 Tax=Pengzhenrongella sicca TaxID=2819238 RepID=A0A8A4ZE87_9MICO|nr:Bax inhibitor-1/YccA family protein [Pengzhenrongella sicca]QTE28866.1 Bax inhibitor-1/YccA family protein [Pengzhenrongella sicca]
MSNPVFDNNAIFRDPKKSRQQPQRGRQQGAVLQDSAVTAAPYDAAALNQMYQSPSATTAQTGRMTYDDVIMKTGGLLTIVVVMAALTWFVVPEESRMGVAIIGALVGFVLGMVNSFKKSPSPALILAYAAAEGVFLGGISWYFEVAFDLPGLVTQAVLATMATFAACLVLFRSGKVRVTPKFTRWLLVSMVGYLVFSLVNVLLMVFNVGGDGAFGPLRSGALGVIVGLFAVGLAAAMLILDFDSIKRGVEQGVPAKFAWTAAFGLVVTLVWMYLEFLRLIAILRGSN